MRKLFLSCVLVCLGLAGCRKTSRPPSGLPPITEAGKNTFGFRMDEEVWVPYRPCEVFANNVFALEYYFIPDSFLVGSPVPGDPLQFHLIAYNTQDGSTFDIRAFYPQSALVSGPGNIIDSLWIEFDGAPTFPTFGNSYYNFNPYYPDSASTRYFQVTKMDRVNKIFSGVFAFTMYTGGAGGNDSVIVTDGRFDLRLDAGSYCN